MASAGVELPWQHLMGRWGFAPHLLSQYTAGTCKTKRISAQNKIKGDVSVTMAYVERVSSM